MKKQGSILGLMSLIGLILFFAAPWRAMFAKPQVATTHSITLTWTASVTPNVTYSVFRSTSATGPFVAVAGGTGITGTSFVDTTANVGVKYFYQVDAIDNVSLNDSGPGNQVSATEPNNPVPPTGLVAVSK